MGFVSATCSLPPSTLFRPCLHSSAPSLPLGIELTHGSFWQQPASSPALRHGSVAPGSCGCLLAPTAPCTCLVAALAVRRAECKHMQYRQPLQTGHTHSLCAKAIRAHACAPTHTQSARHAHASVHTHTSSVRVFVGCRQVQSPRTEGMKAQRACAPAACGWSPVTTLSCLLVLSGPTRTASWRIWTRLG